MVIHHQQQVAVAHTRLGCRLLCQRMKHKATFRLLDVGADAAKLAGQLISFQFARLRLDKERIRVAKRLHHAGDGAIGSLAGVRFLPIEIPIEQPPYLPVHAQVGI